MKIKEELNKLKEEYENLNKKFLELTEDELTEVLGGINNFFDEIIDKKCAEIVCPECGSTNYTRERSGYHCNDCGAYFINACW